MPLGGLGICGGGSEKLRSRRSCGGVGSGFDEVEERLECVGDAGVMGRGGMKSGGGLSARTVEDGGRGGMKSGGFGSGFDEEDEDEDECECAEDANEGT
jgi:hypothetical protein